MSLNDADDAGDTLRIFQSDVLHLIASKEEIDAKDNYNIIICI